MMPERDSEPIEVPARVPTTAQNRAPPQRAVLVLAVWGHRFVQQFLDVGLPTLLAPGNVPGVATLLPTEFVILTGMRDEVMIRNHAAFALLSAACTVRIQLIDDLITDGNHSTTLTLAYTRVVRGFGAAMTETCFLFLVSDYIMADGSLVSVIKRMQKGVSAVLVGNFQIIQEEARRFRNEINPEEAACFSPRQLMRWALPHIHAATLANMAQFPLSHNAHTNRLFWRVDENTMIGRFYLMHPICVRPEVTDFQIGSSWDYSFLPEMCPSHNITAICDSDEYFVVEMQPRFHEWRHLRRGPSSSAGWANSLATWATQGHRDNSRFAVVFHAEELPQNIDEARRESDRVIEQINGLLAEKPPHPYRFHHYWIGAMAVFLTATAQRLDPSEPRRLLNHSLWPYQRMVWFMQRARFAVFGRPPHVQPWHPRWRDMRLAIESMANATAGDGRMLFVCKSPKMLVNWFASDGTRVTRIHYEDLSSQPRAFFDDLRETFDACYLFLHEEELANVDYIVDHVVPLMKQGGRILVNVINARPPSKAKGFGESVALNSGRFLRANIWPVEIQFVPISKLHFILKSRLGGLGEVALRESFPASLVVAAVAAVLGSITVLFNLLGSGAKSSVAQGALLSSILVTLTVARSAAAAEASAALDTETAASAPSQLACGGRTVSEADA